MAVLILLYLGTIGFIYLSSYYEVSNRNRNMLENYVTSYPEERIKKDDGPHEDRPKPESDNPRFDDSPAFKLATFYSVEMSYDGEVRKINNSDTGIYDSSELEKIALEIIDKGKESGTKRNLIYRMSDKGSYILVAFMDNTVMKESMTTLFRYTVIFGGFAVIALFFIAICLAKAIIKPLEESYGIQKQFISDAGHELKTPISVVNANAELLSREIGENRWLSNIQYENERMDTLVRQLLLLAGTENVAVPTERLDFSRLTAGEALPFESVAFEKGLSLTCEITDGIFVDGNSVQLKQLVSILLDNAVRHSNGEEIKLRLSREHGCARLSVVNDGEEIPPEQQKRLFDRFYRVDNARNGEDEHYGLGLAIAKAIVTAHNGKIEPICYNGKVEFAVSLPLQK